MQEKQKFMKTQNFYYVRLVLWESIQLCMPWIQRQGIYLESVEQQFFFARITVMLAPQILAHISSYDRPSGTKSFTFCLFNDALSCSEMQI